ncbi:MAG: glucose 1-dehydrogenase [Verrucomicrobiota bacterium]
MNLKEKIAIVTGAGSGVGQATAIRLAAAGAHVVINYNRSRTGAEETLERIAADGGAGDLFQADVADDAAARALVAFAAERFGGLDILVNNAGVTEFIPFKDLDAVTDEVWQRLLGVNLLGPFHCARAAGEAMRDGGEIVNISSVAGLASIGSSIPYAASKAALNSLTVALARTLAPKIRVNAVAPGFITGRWLEEGLGEHYEPVKQAFEAKVPLNRVCDPDDVAEAVLSLITGSDLVTGQTLTCDSGLLIMDPIGL